MKTLHMKSLKTRLFLFFTGLGILVAVGVGLVMYTQYAKYIKRTYISTLTQAARLVEKQYPELSDPDSIREEGMARSDSYRKLTADFKVLSDSFDVASIYYMQQQRGVYHFIVSSDNVEHIDEVPLGASEDEMFLPYEAPPDEMAAAVRTKTLQMNKEPYTDEFGTFITAILPILKNGQVVGLLGVDYDVSYIQSIERQAQLALIIALVLAIGVSLALALTVSSSFIKPIRRAIDALKTIATGDLTVRIEATSDDEMGEMMQFLNQTQEGIKSLVRTITDKAGALSRVGNELSVMMTQSAAAINQIDATTQGMKAKALTQSASVTETNATVGQIIDNIGALNANIEEQAESVSRSSAAIEQMTANIASVTASLMQNEQNVETLSNAADKGHTALQQVSTDIQEITKESERLLEINKVIQNIASQTNLLSMNAAIEAAHAGEVGKGFAVVADEIRKLAESSSEQAKTVSAVLKNIKASLDGIGSSTRTALNHFEDIDTGVKTVSGQETRIRNAMEEQDAGSREILTTIARSNDSTQKVRQGSGHILAGSTEVVNAGKNLEFLTADLTGGMNEVAAGINQINAAVTRIQEISRENKQSIETLVREIMKFKVK